MGQEVAIKEDYGFLVEFDPTRFRDEINKLMALTKVVLRQKLKDRTMIERLATYRAALVMKAVNYWDQEVRPAGHQSKSASEQNLKSVVELENELGFTNETFSKWRKLVEDGNYADVLVTQWLKAARIIEPDPKEPTGDGPTIVEKAMRLVHKMTPDEYEEFKGELLQFDRARRRPIDPAEAIK